MARIGIVGANNLLAKDLVAALEARQFPAFETKFLSLGVGTAGEHHQLASFEGEPILVEELDVLNLAGLDLVFAAGTAAETARAWELTQNTATPLVDLSGHGGDRPAAALAGYGPSPAMPGRAVIVAHPAAQTLSLVLDWLAECAPVTEAAAVVFLSASERGLAGIQELQKQTASLLSLRSLPEAVFGAQVAFNLQPELGPETVPSLAVLGTRIEREIMALGRGSAPRPVVQVLQAPVFHGGAVSLFVRLGAGVSGETLAAGLQAAPYCGRIAQVADGAWPDLAAVAGEDAILVSRPQPDADGGLWLFFTFDNLRRLAASAADAAIALGSAAKTQ